MRKLIFILALCLVLPCPAAYAQILGPILFGTSGNAGFNTCGAAIGYTNSFTITLAAQPSLSGNLTNKDFIFRGNSFLKTTANGGKSQSSGTDVVFCTTNDNLGTIIPYDAVAASYNATTGAGEWHVLAATISTSVTTTVYGLVGKASATDYSCGTACTGLYINCILVYHMGGYNGSTGSFSTQDVCGGNAGTNHSATGVTNSSFPPVLESVHYNGSTQWFDSGHTMGTSLNSFSVELLALSGGATTDAFLFGNESTATGNPGMSVRQHTGTPCGVSTLCLKLAIIDTSGHQSVRGANVTFTGTFQHWMWTHTTGTTGNAGVVIYLNGALQTTLDFGSSGTLPTDPGSSTSTENIGKCGAVCASPNWGGGQDELRFYSDVKSADHALFDNIDMFNPSGQYTFSTP